MVAIKNMEMPKNCIECNHMDIQQAINCQLIYSGCANCGRHPNCPLVEIEERKVGKWIKTGGSFRCSECMAMPEFKDIRTLKYCPSCGSKMSDIPTGSEMRGAENE